MTVVKVLTYPTVDGVGREVVEVDVDTATVRSVLVDYQAPGRNLDEVARSYAAIHGLAVVA